MINSTGVTLTVVRGFQARQSEWVRFFGFLPKMDLEVIYESIVFFDVHQFIVT